MATANTAPSPTEQQQMDVVGLVVVKAQEEEEDPDLYPASPRVLPDLNDERVKDLIPRLRELIKLRDESIRCGDKQVAISNAKNEALRANLDQVEAEVASLQQALVEANESIRRAGRNRQALEKRIATLELTIEQLQGRDYAIDVSTKQSNKLLLMLEAEEMKQKALEKECQDHKDTIDVLRHKVANSAREFGEIEWKLQDKIGRKTSALTKLQKAYDELVIEHNGLIKKYEFETGEAKARIDNMDKQLWGLKGQPYQLLDRLQKNEDRLQWAMDENDSLNKEMRVVEERNTALSKHLEDSIRKGNGFKEHMEKLRDQIPPLELEVAKLRNSLEFERQDKASVEKQLYEMSQRITYLTQRQVTVEDKATSKEKHLAKIIRDKEGTEQSVAQQLAAKERSLAKQDKKVLVLEASLKQAQEELEVVRQQYRDTTMKDSEMRLHYDLMGMARRRFFDMHVQCLTSLTHDKPGSKVVLDSLTHLQAVDFSGCGLTNDEFVSFLDKLKYCPLIHEFDASNNLLTEEASFFIAEFLGSETCWLHKLDVRYNKFTAQALRRCAIALEHNTTLGIIKVELSHDGLVQAMAKPQPTLPAGFKRSGSGDDDYGGCGSIASSGAGEEEEDVEEGADNGSARRPSKEERTSGELYTVFLLDMRENMWGAAVARPDDTMGGAEPLITAATTSTSSRARVGSRPRCAPNSKGRSGEHGASSGIRGNSSTDAMTIRQIESQRALRNKMTAAAYSSPPTLPPPK